MYVVTALRTLCLMIDKMIVLLNGYLFQLFLGLTQLQFRNSYIFDRLATRLYVLIGIFMVFRVTFSLIQMLANPDMISDKEKGLGKLATRIVISLALLVLTPFIFEKAMELQTVVIEENIIGQVILGVNTNNDTSVKSQGKNLAFQVFKGFISPNEDVSEDDKNNSTSDYNVCKARYEDSSINNIDDLIYPYDDNHSKLNCLTDPTSNDEFPFTYLFLVSTVGSLLLSWMVVGFCIDIAMRLIKLGFYQIIAPIPIISYINGDKNGPFSNWVKKCISTYISVFVKLLIIYFVIYMCNIITTSGIDWDVFEGTSTGVKQLGMVAVLLGLIVFAKTAPKLIKDMFGIKDDEEGGFTKQLAKAALLGGAGMMAAGASNLAYGVGSSFQNAKSAYKGAIENGQNKGRAFLSGFGAGASGLGRGLISTVGGVAGGLRYGAMNGYANKGANPFSGLGRTVLQSNQARYNRSKYRAAGLGLGATVYDTILGRTGLDTKVGNAEKTLKNQLSGIQSARSATSQARYSMITNGRLSEAQSAELNRFSYDAFKKVWYKTDTDTGKITELGNLTEADIAVEAQLAGNADAEEYIKYIKQDAVFGKAEVEINKQLGVLGQIKDKREGKLDK